MSARSGLGSSESQVCALVFDAIDKVWFQMLPRLKPVSCLCVEWMEGPRRVSPKQQARGRRWGRRLAEEVLRPAGF